MIYLCFEKCEKTSESRHLAGIRARDRLFDVFGIGRDTVYTSDTGKPLCRDERFAFSVSHSGDIAVCALKCDIEQYDIPDDIFVIFEAIPSSSIGVDIEEISDSLSVDKMMRVSARFLESEISDKDEFLRAWTRGEAYGKFTGNGITDAKKISIDRVFYSFEIEVFEKKYYLSVCI